MARPALSALLLLALLAPAAAARTVLTDAAGDAALPALDLRSVDLEGGNRSLLDEGRFHMDVRLQVTGLTRADVASYRVTWTAASFHSPERPTSQRGVEFSVAGGLASWRPLIREGSDWSAGPSQPAEADLAAGTLTARGVTTGGGAIPALSRFEAESRAGTDPGTPLGGESVPMDLAAAAGSWTKTDQVRLATVPAPGRPYDLADEPGDAPAYLDLLGVWVDRRPDGFAVTYEVRSLDAGSLEACGWWRASFSQTETDRNELSAFASQTLLMRDRVVHLPFLGGDLEWSPPGQPDHQVETPYAGRLEFGYGSPGRIRAILEGPAWNATTDPDRLFVSAGLDCDADTARGALQLAKDSVHGDGRSGLFAGRASAGPVPVALGALAGAFVGVAAVALVLRRAMR